MDELGVALLQISIILAQKQSDDVCQPWSLRHLKICFLVKFSLPMPGNTQNKSGSWFGT
jgi:hypothetical protein